MLFVNGTILCPIKWIHDQSIQRAEVFNARLFSDDEIEIKTADMRLIGTWCGWTSSGNNVFLYDGHIVEFCGELNGRI